MTGSICSSCGTENPAAAKYCVECGAGLALACPACGTPNPPTAKFCLECASPLQAAARVTSAAAAASPEARSGAAPAPEIVAERRLVSVLFADLVGFTATSESLDPEEVRELLSGYFDVAREVIGRYGGAIEKFIGDAVMAVWGAPAAHEDDAERAVRAGLDLVAAVRRLGGDAALADLGLRAAVMTGEAAVTIGASGQGMVAGDLVNTAARLQAIAPPGSVLVGEATYLAARGAISFEPAGDQLLRGKTAPVPAWRAEGVVAMVGGARRADWIEPLFVGREEEFQVLKDLLHQTGRERRARLVSIIGIAGIGKSRLAWEFEKYIDGLVETIYWHHGRSPAYGEGIAFWALGEMVRRRAGIAETDDATRTADLLEACLREYVSDPGERGWIGPRLRALLGLEGTTAGEREELFAAWRTFFERVADRGTAVLVFEDLHWADVGVLDFIESLLEWSRSRPILIVTLARPELLDRRPTWGASQRHFTSVHLEPLSTAAMTSLVTSLAPGLGQPTVRRIVDRAEGVPLYAIETFRMLVDRGELEARDGRFEVVGALSSIEVPTSLQSLIGARLDSLEPLERTILQDASVLGQSFTITALAAVTGRSPGELEPPLRQLVRRELLAVVADPRSPERGQHEFVQSLIREVAYGTLSKRDRRARHLAAARYFETLGDEELAGVLANHYLDAYRASPAGPEADAVAAQARIALRAAAERALILRSPEQAVTYLEQALQVTSDEMERERLHEQASLAAHMAGLSSQAEEHAQIALESSRTNDDRAGIARASALLGQVLLLDSRIDPAATALQTALEGLPDADRSTSGVELLAHLARAEMFRNDPRAALVWIERGLDAAARIDEVGAIAELLITRAWALSALGRMREAMAVLDGAIAMSREHGLVAAEIRARNNLATFLGNYEPRRSLEVIEPAVELAERIGHRSWIAKLGFRSFVAFEAGEWDRAAAIVENELRDDLQMIAWLPLAACDVVLSAWRGDQEHAASRLDELRARVATDATLQDRSGHLWTEVLYALSRGLLEEAAAFASSRAEVDAEMGDVAYSAWLVGLVAARRGDEAGVQRSLLRFEGQPAVFRSVPAMRSSLRALSAAMAGDHVTAARAFNEAADAFRLAGAIWPLAMSQLEAAIRLPADDPTGRSAREEVRSLAEAWRAQALMEQLEQRLGTRATIPAGPPAPTPDTTAVSAPSARASGP